MGCACGKKKLSRQVTAPRQAPVTRARSPLSALRTPNNAPVNKTVVKRKTI